ncbi:MAG TPA: phosphoglycerate mutase (2,3-diphosphoglycerate-independent), partial [Syntrophales bacterium]|nr:phosphoglycerate mutase (2,3-diphosphoglycerate-independent) [Syntrophales bacterium]
MRTKSTRAMSAAVRQAYRRGEEEETLEPLVLFGGEGSPVGRIKKGDSVIFYNIRGEREVELTRSLVEDGFEEFPVVEGMGLHFVTMVEYQRGLPVEVAFPPEGVLMDTLSDVLSMLGLRQAKVTEAEKAAHLTYFLNGKKGEPLPGEERVIVPTRKDVVLFDEAPEMSISRVTEAVVDKINDR